MLETSNCGGIGTRTLQPPVVRTALATILQAARDRNNLMRTSANSMTEGSKPLGFCSQGQRAWTLWVATGMLCRLMGKRRISEVGGDPVSNVAWSSLARKNSNIGFRHRSSSLAQFSKRANATLGVVGGLTAKPVLAQWSIGGGRSNFSCRACFCSIVPGARSLSVCAVINRFRQKQHHLMTVLTSLTMRSVCVCALAEEPV